MIISDYPHACSNWVTSANPANKKRLRPVKGRRRNALRGTTLILDTQLLMGHFRALVRRRSKKDIIALPITWDEPGQVYSLRLIDYQNGRQQISIWSCRFVLNFRLAAPEWFLPFLLHQAYTIPGSLQQESVGLLFSITAFLLLTQRLCQIDMIMSKNLRSNLFWTRRLSFRR